ncbi:L,D-transpeptidase family protein [Bdellovibrio bacteriovorus]|uniref:L,D-transpeptidase family protein n=1 Tax=Bdellovibrio bacteriovorus TaxID=959 RepID=UPI0021D2DD32|nr:L,D-transpeptidase family protein [Bdellovibrio bacteriovorus]UXR63725.1 L,D-transpeptidase family protein [Bdellovibrio bacteriovorus]
MKLLCCVLMSFFAFSEARAVVYGDHWVALSPEEKEMLEIGLEESPLPSYCPRLTEFAAKARWDRPALDAEADLILVDKKRRLIHLMRQEQILATYTMALGGNPMGHKKKEGDEKTPEGRYIFEVKNLKSEYHLSLGINYPNRKDKAEAHKNGIKDPGDSIMIHGLPNNWVKRKLIRHPRDWTKGCMAVTNSEIEEIFARMPLGGLIEICP